MKTALFLSGQFRFVEDQYEKVLKNVIIPNNIEDIFIHGWYDEESIKNPYKYGGSGGWKDQRIKKDIDKRAIELYNPKKYKIDEVKSFKNSSIDFFRLYHYYYYGGALIPEDKEPDFRNRQINNTYSMWYSIQQSYLLCQEYALDNDIQYDCVIRMRFDIVPTSPIIVSNYSMDNLNYTLSNQPDNLINDWFNFGSNRIMGIYSSIFNIMDFMFDDYHKNNKPFCSEAFIRDIMNIYGISSKGHNWSHDIPRF